MDTLAEGIQLAHDLEKEALRFHVKSDDHEILMWEAAIVVERVCAMREGRMPREDLRESALLGAWGERTSALVPALTERVGAFYRVAEQNANQSSQPMPLKRHG